VISSWGGRRYTPYAFTEHGAFMLSSVLKSVFRSKKGINSEKSSKYTWQAVDKYNMMIGEKEGEMTRLELLTLLLSIQALLESGNIEKAKEIIAEVITEARRS